MEFTFRSRWVEVNVRTKRMYSPAHDKFFPAQLAARLGDWLWSTGKGFRKLGGA
jgi:hypothetical protein